MYKFISIEDSRTSARWPLALSDQRNGVTIVTVGVWIRLGFRLERF